MRRHGFHDLIRCRPGKHIQAMCILALRLQPAFQIGDRGQRDKRTEVRQFVAQLVNHLFDQKVSFLIQRDRLGRQFDRNRQAAIVDHPFAQNETARAAFVHRVRLCQSTAASKDEAQ